MAPLYALSTINLSHKGAPLTPIFKKNPRFWTFPVGSTGLFIDRMKIEVKVGM